MAGSPELAAHITGTNEFSPGDDVNLVIAVDNTGLNEYKIVQSGIIDRAGPVEHGKAAHGNL